jgi:hypothetical protein
MDAVGGNESVLYTDDELKVSRGGKNSAGSSTPRTETLESEDARVDIIEPYMQSVWVAYTDLRLQKWRDARAKDVLLSASYMRARPVDNSTGAALHAPHITDIHILLESAVTEALFSLGTCNHLFNCMPVQLTRVMSSDLAVGVAGMDTDDILALERQLLCAERLSVLCSRYETTGLLNRVLDENLRLSETQ